MSAPRAPHSETVCERQHLRRSIPGCMLRQVYGSLQTVHFIRHGQGYHNVAGEADSQAYKSGKFEDAHLTELGWQQVGPTIEAMLSVSKTSTIVTKYVLCIVPSVHVRLSTLEQHFTLSYGLGFKVYLRSLGCNAGHRRQPALNWKMWSHTTFSMKFPGQSRKEMSFKCTHRRVLVALSLAGVHAVMLYGQVSI